MRIKPDCDRYLRISKQFVSECKSVNILKKKLKLTFSPYEVACNKSKKGQCEQQSYSTIIPGCV